MQREQPPHKQERVEPTVWGPEDLAMKKIAPEMRSLETKTERTPEEDARLAALKKDFYEAKYKKFRAGERPGKPLAPEVRRFIEALDGKAPASLSDDFRHILNGAGFESEMIKNLPPGDLVRLLREELAAEAIATTAGAAPERPTAPGVPKPATPEAAPPAEDIEKLRRALLLAPLSEEGSGIPHEMRERALRMLAEEPPEPSPAAAHGTTGKSPAAAPPEGAQSAAAEKRERGSMLGAGVGISVGMLLALLVGGAAKGTLWLLRRDKKFDGGYKGGKEFIQNVGAIFGPTKEK